MNLAHQSLLYQKRRCAWLMLEREKHWLRLNLYSKHITRKNLFCRTACACFDTFFGETLSSRTTHPTLEQICQNGEVTKSESFTPNLGLAESAINHLLCIRTMHEVWTKEEKKLKAKQRRQKLHRNISLVWSSPRCEIASRAFCVNSHNFPSFQAREIDMKVEKMHVIILRLLFDHLLISRVTNCTHKR